MLASQNEYHANSSLGSKVSRQNKDKIKLVLPAWPVL